MIQYIICFIALVIGSITDLKTQEVPDYVNYSLIATGFCLAILSSIIFKDYSYSIASLIGFGLCFIFSVIMYYTGQWGGGDAKMLMGIGAMIGLPYKELLSFSFLATFVVLIFFIGGIYGTLWMLVFLIQHWKPFKEKYYARKQNTKTVYALYGTIIILFIASFIVEDFFLKVFLIACGFLVFILYYMFIIIKILEQIAFIKDLPVDKATEGDWVAEYILVDKKVIITKKNLGITKEQLAELKELAAKGKLQTVKLKYGIPFVPSFLIAFIVTVIIF